VSEACSSYLEHPEHRSLAPIVAELLSVHGAADLNESLLEDLSNCISSAPFDIIAPVLDKLVLESTSFNIRLLNFLIKAMLRGQEKKFWPHAVATIKRLMMQVGLAAVNDQDLTLFHQVLNASTSPKELKLAVGAPLLYHAITSFTGICGPAFPFSSYLPLRGYVRFRLADEFLLSLREALLSEELPGSMNLVGQLAAEDPGHAVGLPSLESWRDCKATTPLHWSSPNLMSLENLAMYKYCLCSKQHPVEALLKLAREYDVGLPPFAADKLNSQLNDMTPAMVAAVSGHDGMSSALATAYFNADVDRESPIYRLGKHPMVCIAALMLVIWSAGYAVQRYNKQNAILIRLTVIMSKGSILLAVNCAIKFVGPFSQAAMVQQR